MAVSEPADFIHLTRAVWTMIHCHSYRKCLIFYLDPLSPDGSCTPLWYLGHLNLVLNTLKIKRHNYTWYSSWLALSGRLPHLPGELPAPRHSGCREVKSFAKTVKLLMDVNILAFTSSEVCHLHVVIYAALTFFSRSLRLKI